MLMGLLGGEAEVAWVHFEPQQKLVLEADGRGTIIFEIATDPTLVAYPDIRRTFLVKANERA